VRPVLAIQGTGDEYGSMAQLDEVAKRVKGRCQLVKLEGCGHAPFKDQPEMVLNAVTNFIAGVA
jgi:pimeloyl-ACP methyl ester carboxylesterase